MSATAPSRLKSAPDGPFSLSKVYDFPSPENSARPAATERPPHLMLVVEDDRWREHLQMLAMEDGWRVTALAEPEPLLRGRISQEPDLIVLVPEYQELDGLELCSDLRMSETFRHTPVLFIADTRPSPEAIARTLLAGADDFIADVDDRWPEVRARLRVQLRNKRYRDTLSRLRLERDGLRTTAATDPLTGVLNRRSLDALLPTVEPDGAAFCFVDVDHFKHVNDRYGHDIGDVVLRGVAGCLAQHIRSHDSCARYGGEEFVVVLAHVGVETARAAAERYRVAISALDFTERGGPPCVTVSIGVALFESDNELPEHVLKRADEALYHAKRTGRNRVVVSPYDMLPTDLSIPPLSPAPRSAELLTLRSPRSIP